MSLCWTLVFSITILSIIDVQVHCNCFSAAPSSQSPPLEPPVPILQVARCGRSTQPTFHLIPAGLYSNGFQHFIRPLPLTQPQLHLDNNKRQTRQQQPAVIQQVTINQNTALSGEQPQFEKFKSLTNHRFGGLKGRSYDETSGESIKAPNCPLNYVFSCQPTITEAPCKSSHSCY